jgi:hypothetical protein
MGRGENGSRTDQEGNESFGVCTDCRAARYLPATPWRKSAGRAGARANRGWATELPETRTGGARSRNQVPPVAPASLSSPLTPA